MNHDIDIEIDLRQQLRVATDGMHASPALWAEAERRGRRRLRQRRLGLGAGAVGVVGVLVGGGLLLTSPPAVPSIEPAAPGDEAPAPDDGRSHERQAEAEARVRAEEEAGEAAPRGETGATRRQVELEATEQARRAAERDALGRHPDRSEPAAPIEPLPPIRGYGDFADVSFFELDHYAVTERVGQCVLDAGFNVELAAPGDGLAFLDTDPDRLGLAYATAEACRAGLNLPEPAATTVSQQEIVYAHHLAVHQCLTDAGLEPTPPPALQRSRAGEGWAPYDGLVEPGGPLADPADFEAIQMRCPQQPVGGFAIWSPGDPVQPVDRLPVLDR